MSSTDRRISGARSARQRIANLAIALAAAGSFAAGCSDKGERAVTPPQEKTHSMSGSVVLLATLTDEQGTPVGIEQIDDPDGVWVFCRHAGGGTDSTQTIHGRYSFPNVPAGSCTLYTSVVPRRRLAEMRLEMPERDEHVTQALSVTPSGDLRIYPNPSPEEGSGVEFTTEASGEYRVSVLDLSGRVVWSYGQSAPAGFYHVHWAGSDQDGVEAPAGPYWIVAEYDGKVRYGLLLWGHDHGEPAGEGHCGHIVASGMVIAHHDERIVTCWLGRRDGDLRAAPGQTGHELQALFLDADSTAFAIADSCPDNRLTWTIADSSIAALRPVPGRKWQFRVAGKAPGTTEVTFDAWHEEHVHFRSPAIPIVVE
ncbi:MAG: FlgD immunoglobulin-like domain containing protein [Candidatus Eisenbacteria bacterium]|nr:FlgD immunoglobulin-like domain containing protein [Candidatus Eisenbacteria bacterium]